MSKLGQLIVDDRKSIHIQHRRILILAFVSKRAGRPLCLQYIVVMVDLLKQIWNREVIAGLESTPDSVART